MKVIKEEKINWTQVLERESARVEWKDNVYNEEYVVQTLCAFANDIQQLGGGGCSVELSKNQRPRGKNRDRRRVG